MTPPGDELLQLAHTRFPDLTNAEGQFLRAAALGTVARYGGQTAEANHLLTAETWGQPRIIRADVIRWLCVDQGAIRCIDPKGLRVACARIEGHLDLAHVIIPFPLVLEHCSLRGGVDLTWAETRLLRFVGSHSGSFIGEGLAVQGDLFLSSGFQAEGEVQLSGARITGRLDCTEGVFRHPGGIALHANAAKVGDMVFCGIRAEGEVRLIGATISGQLDCSRGHFLNPGQLALDAGGVTSTDMIFRGVQARGEVRLIGATITGDLSCSGGHFLNPGQLALAADGVKAGSVALDDGFQAQGEVRLVSATITSSLNCSGGHFHHPQKDALIADLVTVNGPVLFRDGFQAEGVVRLVGATIAGDLACNGGAFRNPGKNTLVADAVTVRGRVFLRSGFQSEGVVRLVGGTIGLHLDLERARFGGKGPNGLIAANLTVTGEFRWTKVIMTKETMLDLSATRVGQLVDDEPSWPAAGQLDLDEFTYTAIPDGPMDAHRRLCWLARQTALPLDPTLEPSAVTPKPFRPKPYQQLAKVLRESGRETDATRILIAQEKARRKYGELGWWAWAWNMLLGATIGHGYRPWQALLWAVFWVALGGFLFGAGYNKEIVIPARAEAYDTTKKTRQETAFYHAFNRWLYSLDTLVPIINFGQKDYWAPQVSCNKSGLIRGGGIRLCILGILNNPGIRVLYLYRWLHIFVGWVLITLAVAEFTGLVRKK
jgi:hypothetical protein